MTVTQGGASTQDGEVRPPVLSVRDLRVTFATPRGTAHVVNGLSYDLAPGETLAVVGESGSGKSVSMLSMLGLVPSPPARVTGAAYLDGRDLLSLSREDLRRVRGPGVGVVFQDPMTSLNPVLTVGRQLTEGMCTHLGLSRSDARERGANLLARVGIPDPRGRLNAYPHQLSGGMRQRVMIAIALACEPRVLVADEATTALDVTVQAQIVELLRGLQRELGMAMIWISHDLGVVAGVADRVMVIYAGRVVEHGAVDAVYARPRHPYTRGLLASLPGYEQADGVLAAAGPSGAGDDLSVIPGLPPDPVNLPRGCAFHPRCAFRLDERCAREVPPLRDADARGGVGASVGGHQVATFYDPEEGR